GRPGRVPPGRGARADAEQRRGGAGAVPLVRRVRPVRRLPAAGAGGGDVGRRAGVPSAAALVRLGRRGARGGGPARPPPPPAAQGGRLLRLPGLGGGREPAVRPRPPLQRLHRGRDARLRRTGQPPAAARSSSEGALPPGPPRGGARPRRRVALPPAAAFSATARLIGSRRSPASARASTAALPAP